MSLNTSSKIEPFRANTSTLPPFETTMSKMIEQMENQEAWFVGDLCYVMDDVWNEVCNLIFPSGGHGVYGKHTLRDGRSFVVFSTYFGDGVYPDQFGNSYPVDAGLIGAIRKSDIRDRAVRPDLGTFHVMTPSDVFNGSYEKDGTIVIGGKVCIETRFDEDF